MARPGALVDRVSSLAPAATARALKAPSASRQLQRVKFEGGGYGMLDMSVRRSAIWADVIQSLQKTQQPVYVQIEPRTNLITELLLPIEAKVVGVGATESGDAVVVDLMISHARHYLRRTNPDFADLLRALHAAHQSGQTVLVTETLDEHEIIDVRPAPSQRRPRRA